MSISYCVNRLKENSNDEELKAEFFKYLLDSHKNVYEEYVNYISTYDLDVHKNVMEYIINNDILSLKFAVYILPYYVRKEIEKGNKDNVYNVLNAMYTKKKFYNYYRLVFFNGDKEMIKWSIEKMEEYPPSGLSKDEQIIYILGSAYKYNRMKDIIDILEEMGYNRLELVGLFLRHFDNVSEIYGYNLLSDVKIEDIRNELIKYINKEDLTNRYGDNKYLKGWYEDNMNV